LQKINFGSATLFRLLMWFDRIDPRDPLKLTDGVYGLLLRYYFHNNTNIWLWGLYSITNLILHFFARLYKHEDHPPQRRFVLRRILRKHQESCQRQIRIGGPKERQKLLFFIFVILVFTL